MIYIIAHRPVEYGFWSNGIYRPIQVGKNPDFLDLRDNQEEDNISYLNWLYAENTATYYIWKHRHDKDFKGQCQYRRRLKFDSVDEIMDLLSRNGVIVPKHLNHNPYSMYAGCHSMKDMEISRGIIEQKFPDMLDAWNDIIVKGNKLLYSDSFIMTPEDYDRWSEFLFSFGDEFIKRSWNDTAEAYDRITQEMNAGIRKKTCPSKDNPDRYQHQVLAFLTERLLTMWVYSKYDNPCEIPYTKMEII